MAVRRKPNTVEEFINAGGSPAGIPIPSSSEIQTPPEEPKETKPEKREEETIAVTLRVPRDLLAELDAAAKKCRPKRSRNSWILEAIIEKLEGEGTADQPN